MYNGQWHWTADSEADTSRGRPSNVELGTWNVERGTQNLEPRTLKLILFDIDGTLLRVTRTGARLLRDVLGGHLGLEIVTDGVRFSGRTDIPIIREVLLASGVAPDEVERSLPTVIAAYEAEALRFLTDGRVELLPGVKGLLDQLSSREDVVLGLLTGNIETLAYAKLRAGGLSDYFQFGAFGSDRENRYELPEVALERAFESTGHRFEGKNVVIIGDTEYDILCGRSLGVFTVAVATGHFDRAYLDSHQPDLLLDDFSDPNPLLEAVFIRS